GKPAKLFTTLLTELDRKDTVSRRNAVYALEQIGPFWPESVSGSLEKVLEPSLEKLMKELKSPKVQVRRDSALILADFGPIASGREKSLAETSQAQDHLVRPHVRPGLRSVRREPPLTRSGQLGDRKALRRGQKKNRK